MSGSICRRWTRGEKVGKLRSMVSHNCVKECSQIDSLTLRGPVWGFMFQSSSNTPDSSNHIKTSIKTLTSWIRCDAAGLEQKPVPPPHQTLAVRDYFISWSLWWWKRVTCLGIVFLSYHTSTFSISQCKHTLAVWLNLDPKVIFRSMRILWSPECLLLNVMSPKMTKVIGQQNITIVKGPI